MHALLRRRLVTTAPGRQVRQYLNLDTTHYSSLTMIFCSNFYRLRQTSIDITHFGKRVVTTAAGPQVQQRLDDSERGEREGILHQSREE